MISRRDLLAAAMASATPMPALAQAGSAPGASGPVFRHAAHRDLTLPDRGPYSDHLNGISHVTDPVRGLRMDFALAPAILRRETLVPYAGMGLFMQPVRADPELSYIAWDCELAAGVTVRLEWLMLDAHGGLLRATAHNHGQSRWPLLLNWLARLAPPANPPHTRMQAASGITPRAVKGQPALPAEVVLPPSGLWVNALDYDRFEWGEERFDDHLVPDGRRRGEIFEDGFVGSTGIGQGFGKTAGDQAQWRLRTARPFRGAVARFRFRMTPGTAAFRLGGLGRADVRFTAADETFQSLDVALGPLPAGDQILSLTAAGGKAIDLNGFVLIEASEAPGIAFRSHAWGLEPQRRDDVAAGRTILAFPQETADAYGLAWNGDGRIHGVRTDDVRTLVDTLNDPSLFAMDRVPQATGPGWVTIVTPEVIDLGAGETVIRDCFVAVGGIDTIPEIMKSWQASDFELRLGVARAKVPVATQGHREGAERLLATAATNLLFPIWTGGQWVRNYCPGREWPSVYTWDSGFTGLGLAHAAPRLSTALLDTYLSPLDDDQAAFLHHGTPLPTQFYLFHELWNRSGDLDFARRRYPGLARYLRFLLGRETGSTCRDLASGLIRTYDYFYNAGGMDDYPAQMAVHRQDKAGRVAPVISSAHVIRCARIRCQVAEAVGATQDMKEWRGDVESLAQALQTHSWDEASGYFAYVEHDADKRPVGHQRSPAGENFNMGLDGVSPLVADICTPAQVTRLIDNLMTPGRLWTPAGITAVDRRASYYDATGYWNGTVWMPHQWLMWKALLDYGEGGHAWQVARTALDVYSAEIARSGRCYEHFDAETGVGGGWSPFSALSSPIRNWFEAYHQPGTLSTGFNTRVVRRVWDGGRTMKAALDISGEHTATVLAVFDHVPAQVRWQGRPVTPRIRAESCLEIQLPPGRGDLEIA